MSLKCWSSHCPRHLIFLLVVEIPDRYWISFMGKWIPSWTSTPGIGLRDGVNNFQYSIYNNAESNWTAFTLNDTIFPSFNYSIHWWISKTSFQWILNQFWRMACNTPLFSTVKNYILKHQNCNSLIVYTIYNKWS